MKISWVLGGGYLQRVYGNRQSVTGDPPGNPPLPNATLTRLGRVLACMIFF